MVGVAIALQRYFGICAICLQRHVPVYYRYHLVMCNLSSRFTIAFVRINAKFQDVMLNARR